MNAAKQIRTLVTMAARKFITCAPSEPEMQRRHRQFALLSGRCDDKKSPAQLANEYGMSVRQCYRDCSQIQRWIGAFVRSYDPLPGVESFHGLSAFRFELERASARTEAGDYDRARRVYESLVSSAGGQNKIEALCNLAELELELGNFAAAETLLSALLNALTMNEAAAYGAEARVRVELDQARLAWATGDFEPAMQSLSLAKAGAERLSAYAGRAVNALRAEVAIESANRAMDYGEFVSAQTYIQAAVGICNSDATLKLIGVDTILTQINLNLTRMRPGSGVSLQQQVRLANQAQEIALQSGSIKRRLLVEAAQVGLQTAYEHAPREIARVRALVARFPNPLLAATLSMEFADYLLQGRHWRMAGHILSEEFPARSYKWALLMHLKGSYFLRAHQPLAAQRCEELAFDVTLKSGNARLQAATLRGLGMTAHLLGRPADAADYIVAAVPIADQHSGLTSCRKTYESAALITGLSSYARKAAQLRQVEHKQYFLPP